jgi:O-acetyl-ADP-ribose deacetylase
MPTTFSLMQQGVTNLSSEAIVNGTNIAFLGKDGICQKGGSLVQKACLDYQQSNPNLKIGDTFITTGGALSAKQIIHVISPRWGAQAEDESNGLLALCYTNALKTAQNAGIRIIGLPTISTGLEGFPKKTAADVATRAVADYVKANPSAFQAILFVCAENTEYKIYEKRWDSFKAEMANL